MKLVSLVMVAGLVLLYFMDAAFNLQLMSWEMLIHSAIRFFGGFIILGTGVFYAHKIKLKRAVYLILVLVLADDIMDYFRNVNNFRFEAMIYSSYMLLWGALMGYLFMKRAKDKAGKQ